MAQKWPVVWLMRLDPYQPTLAASGHPGYAAAMSPLLNRLALHVAQRLAARPEVQEKAAQAARAVVEEAKLIARDEDRARAAGRSFRRLIDNLRGDRPK